MADDLTQGLGIGDDELQRQRRIYGQIGPSDSAVGPVTPPQAPNIPGPSANDKTPPLTLRGISPAPNIQQRTSADEAEAKRIQDTGSGISQIQHGSKEGGIGIAKPHPILGGFLRGLDVVGSAIAPGVMANIPGTELHHEQLGQGARARIGSDVEEQGREATAAHTQAETAAIPAQTAHVNAETNALAHPEAKPKEEKWDHLAGYTDTDGTPLLNEESSGQVVRASDKKPPTGFKAVKPEQPFQTDKTVRVVNGVPHEILVDKQTGADVKDLGQTKVPGESPADKRSATESAQVERESRGNIRKAADQYRATEQSVTQLTAAIDQAKDGNGLLTSFVPTMEVLGINASNGVHRISPAEAHAAGVPGGWAEQFNAWFDKASSGEISPQLQKEGKALAQILKTSAYQRYKSIYNDENGIVSGYGGTGFDKRVPMIQSGEAPGEASGGGAAPSSGSGIPTFAEWKAQQQHQ